jgi:flagellar hook-associated protein 3 FlgL
MSVNSVSSATLSGILSNSVMRMQVQMTTLEVENSTGRLADIGLSLGAGSGAVISLHQQMGDLDALTQSNAMVASQLETSANALSNLQKIASSALAQAINGSSVQPNTTGAIAMKQAAMGALDSFTSMANAAAGDVFAFGGQNTDSAPMNSYTTAAQARVQSAFQTYFGFAVTDPQVSTITAASMKGFLQGPYADLFSDPFTVPSNSHWSDWSSATQQAMTNRITASQTITTSITANDASFRNMAQGLTMLAEFGGLNLQADAFSALVTASQSTLNTANNQMIEANAAVGTMQSTVTQAISAVSLQQDVLTMQINARETVDPYLVGTQLNALSNQLQVAYSLTSQLHKLSLVNFL